ncbi:zinc finger protein 37-like [Battus philenor]|uniref:zinc finger protein 37-like n=1 Tax=Battus philenor TaxID=42288 RepID=UPI0035CFEFF1
MMETKAEEIKNIPCMACLTVEYSLTELGNDKTRQYYVDCISEINVGNMPKTITICWDCHALLRKAVNFREQVKDSFRILQTYTNETLAVCLLTEISRPPRLKVCSNKILEILPIDGGSMKENCNRQSERVKDELKMEAQDRDSAIMENQSEFMGSSVSDCSDVEQDTDRLQSCHKKSNSKRKLANVRMSEGLDENFIDNKELESSKPKDLQIVCVKDELKVEFIRDSEDSLRKDCPTSGCSDAELETELKKFLKRKNRKKSKGSDKTVAKKRKKMEKCRSEKKVDKQEQDAEKKILTVKLTYEEMLIDRQKESSKDSYVKAVFKCETCIIGFNSSKSHKSHLATKHSPDLGRYSCPICSTVVSSVESFTEHCKRHFRRYECSICRKRTMDKKAIEQHYFTAHEISLKEYQCNLCGKISNSIDSHRYHRDSHKSRVQCTDCEKTFSHRAGLMNHRLAVHEFHNTFSCTVCDKVFRWRTSLKRHLEKHDMKTKEASSGEKAFCVTCGIEFSSICSYRRHLRNSLKHVTRDQLKFICDHCNKRFADKTKLRDHIEEKHLHKVYQCHICNKATKNRVGLDQHVRYVHKSRPNNKMCHYCGKGFPTKVQLESHIRTHTGERPFICEFCPTTFSQKSNLYKHNRQVHLNIKTKRYPLCKKRKEERKSSDPPAYQPEDTAPKPSEPQRANYPEIFNVSRERGDEYIVGW